jgi:hypothetical protein
MLLPLTALGLVVAALSCDTEDRGFDAITGVSYKIEQIYIEELDTQCIIVLSDRGVAVDCKWPE